MFRVISGKMFGYLLRNYELIKGIVAGKIEVKRGRGKTKLTYSANNWLKR